MHRVIGIIASAGGMHALERILADLPPSFSGTLIILLHLDPHRPSHLAEIFARATPLVTRPAAPGDRLEPGHVYVAPPGQHLRVAADGRLDLRGDAPVRFLRPSGNVLLQSMAEHLGPAAAAVILTGTGSDGAEGVRAIKERGGTVIVQDEATAEYAGMPRAAIATGLVDWSLPLAQIAPKLVQLVSVGDPHVP